MSSFSRFEVCNHLPSFLLSISLSDGSKGGGGRSISLAASRAKLAAATATAKKATTAARGKGKAKGKAAKKVFSLTGQKFETPEEREPLRIFYESLSKQIPSSEMAQFWLMEHGLLSPERAKQAYDRKLKRQQQIKSGTPIKASNSTTVTKFNNNNNNNNNNNKPAESSKKPAVVPSSTSRSSTDHSAAKAKRRVDYSDDDDDKEFIVKLKRPNFSSNSKSRGG
ncbi:hypothetical protein D1007_57983 [Hordeum vulgare]|nr:hypothetical protein D1007_57983 [Hordeum vulgare]